jgi:hypothetical protein
LEVYFFVGDQVLLGSREREGVTIFIGGSRHGCCRPSWYRWCDVKFQFL